ncbi:GNAT family N-acetyltransferase, partial [Acidimicrobiaceae bacterium USS-CC1]|nr:GNAT family N-acetyltransferase [Acidiferrimicrobium australe]
RAGDAATRAGVRVGLLRRPPDLVEAHRLLAQVWGGEPDVGPDLLRAIGFAGGCVAGAHRDGTLVGVSVALVGWHPDDPAPHLHSHVTGTAPEAQGGGIGFALKQHQRAWALAQGFGEVVWTFDPLLRRNAWFNLARLGAGAPEYLVDFYGDMLDPVNAGQGSDRLLVRWRLDSPAARAAAT